MDALLQKHAPHHDAGKKRTPAPSPDKAKDFLSEASRCREKKYKSTGHGWDFRFEGEKIVGSALLYRKKGKVLRGLQNFSQHPQ